MTIRGISLAAGLATRLRPLTTHRPKAAMPVLGIPSLYFSFWQFQRLGLKHWAVNCHHQAALVKQLVSVWPGPEEIHISYEENIQGSAGCYPLLNEWRQGDHLIVYNPDILCDFDLNLAVERFEREQPAALVVYTTTPPPGGRPTVHLDTSGRVIGLGLERPAGSQLSVYGAGMFLLHKKLLDRIPPGPSSLSTHLSHAINSGEAVLSMAHDGFWLDMGDSHERYFQAQRQTLAHVINKPESVFSEAVTSLWQLTGFFPKLLDFPNDPRPETMSLIDERTKIPSFAKIGPSCFIFGEHRLDSSFAGSQCLVSWDSSNRLSGQHTAKIVMGQDTIDLPIQAGE